MTAFHVSVFKDRAASTIERRSMTLLDLERMSREQLGACKADLPLIKLATFGDARTPKNSLRHNANVLSITGVEADYDAKLMDIEEAGDRLRLAGIEALIYTSPSHMPDWPRWRVLCPLSEARPPQDRRGLVARLNGALGGILATESFTLSQAFYIGQTPDSFAPSTMLITGRPLDLVPGLPSIEPEGRAADPLALPPATPGQAPDERCMQALAAVDVAFAGSDNRHHTMLSATNALAPFVLSGHLAHADAVGAIRDAMTDSGRAPNDGEVESAMDGALRYARPHTPPSDGSEFGQPAGGRRVLSPTECAGVTARPYLVKGLLAEGDVGCLFGPPGAGKSLIAPLLAYNMAQGVPFFGHRTRQRPVLYVAAEDQSGMERRVKALGLVHGDAPNLGLVQGVSDLLNDTSGDLAWLLAEVAHRKPGLIVIDTLAMAFPGLIENDADGMGRVVAVGEKLAAGGAAVLLVHHSTKAGDGTPRGHSLLNGRLDMSICLDPKDAQGVIRGSLRKNRNGPCDVDLAFVIGVERLGVDEDGDPVTAPYALVLPADALPAPTPKLTPAQRAALDLLPADGTGIPDADWLASCGGQSSAATPKDKAKMARKMRAALVQKGVIEVVGDFIRRVVGGPRGDQAGTVLLH